MADLSAYRVVATVPDVHAWKLAAGMRAHVVISNMNDYQGIGELRLK